MEKTRENLKQQALKRFEDTAKKYSYHASHLVLWDLLWKQMSIVLGNKIEATRHTYRDPSQHENVVIEFEKHLKHMFNLLPQTENADL